MKAGRIERWALILGGLLVLVWGGARLHSILGAKRELRRFEAARPRPAPTVAVAASEPTQPPALIEPEAVDFRLWSPNRVRAYEASRQGQNGAPLAVLRVPSIGLEVAVLEGTDELTLNRAVGRIAGTARPGGPGNLGIAGHRDGFFRGLKDLALGGAMELETLDGTRRLYTVQDIWIVRPDAIGVLDPTPQPSLTLVTCYPFYYVGSAPERYIVRAVLGEASPSVAP